MLLSGCLNYSADVSVSKDDLISGTVILTRETKPMGGVEVLPSPAPLPSNAPGSTAPNKIEFPKPVSNADSIVVTPYADGTNVGYKIEYQRATFKEAAAFTPLGDRGGALVFTRDGDTVKFTASFDLTFDAGTEAQKALLAKNVAATVKLDLPGAVSDSNGTVADNAVTWTVEPLKANDLTATYTSAAPAASAAPSGSTAAPAEKNDDGMSSTTWIIIGAVVLGLLLIGGVLVGLLRRRKNARQGAASGIETPPSPGDAAGPETPSGLLQDTYPAHVPAPAMGISPFAAPPSFASAQSAPQQFVPQPAESPSDQSDDEPKDENPNEQTTTYAIAERKREEPVPESDVPESSAMARETPPVDGPSSRGGWPPPQPKWKQEP